MSRGKAGHSIGLNIRAIVTNIMKLIKFGFIGIANTILSYTTFVFLVKIKVYYLLASAISFMFGTTLSYVLNTRYTFKNSINFWVYIKFSSVSITSLCISLLILYVLKELFCLNVYLAQIAVVIARFPLSYLVNREMVFLKNENKG